MKRFLSPSFLGLILAVTLASAPSAFAQRKPPAPPPELPASASALGDVTARVLHLEQMIEQLTGQNEELKFQNGQMSKQLQQLQDDLSMRVARVEATLGGALPPMPQPQAAATPGPNAAAEPAALAPVIPASVSPTAAAMTATPAYDPNGPMSSPVSKQPDYSMPAPSAQAPQAIAQSGPATTTTLGRAPTNVEAPQAGGDSTFTIRTDGSGKPLAADPDAPKAPPPSQPLPPAPAPKAAPAGGPVATAGLNSAPAAVALPNGTPKQQYDYAFDFLKRQDYGRAEGALREFLKKNPKDALAGNAQYWLGESLYVRGDYQSAAQEFLTGYQTYPKSAKGPDSLLKLGMAMSHLNQQQGACTALGRIAKEYPDASDQIRNTAKAERTRLKCT